LKKNDVVKPGSIAKTSGQYGLVNKSGILTKIEVTVVEGHRLPPTPKPGMGYTLVDVTIHSGDKKP
jgi:hypothetical protein